MAALKTNKLIPIMVVAFVVLAGTVFFKASSSKVAQPVVADAGQWMRTAPTPRTADGDTSNDTIRAIHGEVTASKKQAGETLEMNKQLIERLDEVMTEKKEIEENQEKTVEQQLLAQSAAQARQFDVMMAKMGEMVNAIGDVEVNQRPTFNATQTVENSQAMEIPDGFGTNIEAGQFVSGEDLIEVFWIEPLDESINNRVDGGRPVPVQQNPSTLSVSKTNKSLDEAKAVLMKPLDTYRELIDDVGNKGSSLHKSNNDLQFLKRWLPDDGSQLVEVKARYRGPVKKQAGTRVYRPAAEERFTIPDLSILSGAIATTSLVGKIYPDGNVVDPQYFKLIVGRDNFTANFHDLPAEIEGMIFEGYGIGDFTTRCVSGRLVAATFIFEDGTTRSIYPGDPGSRPENRNSRTLGYITDPYGNPCVSGKLITDAKEYFATGSALAFASAYAGAIRESAQTTTESFDDTGLSGSRRTSVTGDIGEFALATGANAGLDRGVRWLDEMFSNSRSLIYAPSGMSVDIHLQQELRIDIASNSRKIRYRKNANRQTELD